MSPYDGDIIEAMGAPFMDAIREDRTTLLVNDSLRSLVFVVLAAFTLWLYSTKKFKQTLTVAVLTALVVFDLVGVDRRYVNSEDFVNRRVMEQPFQKTAATLQLEKETGRYRVYDAANNAFNSAEVSYTNSSIGGYHAAKPRRMQQLFDYQIAKNNVRVLNMLNVKYVIQSDENGQKLALVNPAANGNAWFVEEVITVKSADEEMKSLDNLDSKNVAIYGGYNENASSVSTASIWGGYKKDSLATIKLDLHSPNHLKYTSDNANDGLAVFSEMYYSKGWKAAIDGQEAPIFNVNYVLRGLQTPAGKHTIEFKFEPEVVKTGGTIALISTILMVLLVGLGLYFQKKS